jgi:hypothetical protein
LEPAALHGVHHTVGTFKVLEIKMNRFIVATTSLVALAGVSHAQTNNFEGLVNVNIQDVLQDIAVDLNVSDTNIPVTLQVPISLAANVCDVSVNVLSAQVASGDASCAAVTGSQELTQIVQQEMSTGGTDQAADEPASDNDLNDDIAGGDENTSEDDVAADDELPTGDEDVAVDEDGIDEMPTASTNSAREFAPGQQQQPANEVAPGQQASPSEAAPGQRKRIDEAPAN